MMVTFVAQCEKKALPKTRRVLDAFANRIGSRTWQTVITTEGLKAVKKLLRQTASKNTAVSCHWIRSRSRSDLVWIVGKKDKFNNQGITPVNYTDGELIMDELTVKTENILANTGKQPLSQHLFGVGYLAYLLILKVVNEQNLAQAVFVAGYLHDLGKLDPIFQQWLTTEINKKKPNEIPAEGQHITKSGKFSFEQHPRHNEISLLFYFLLDDEKCKIINKRNKDLIRHTLYWHHAKPIRKEEFKKLQTIYNKFKKNIGGNGKFSEVIRSIPQLAKKIDTLSETFGNRSLPKLASILTRRIDNDRTYDLKSAELPYYKHYLLNDDIEDYHDEIEGNSWNNLARTALVTADRLISALSCDELKARITEGTLHELCNKALATDRGLKGYIKSCLSGFETRFPNSERNIQQAKAAKDLAAVESVGVLQGAAGCGKSKIALEWAANTDARKMIWICPRVQVCQGIVADLSHEDYLSEVKIEINTGEFKEIYQHGKSTETLEGREFSGDVVVTTIDQITNAILTHKNITSLITYMDAHVVFDEFHEYINMPAFNLLFAELVKCKQMQEDKTKVLLVSATPNYFFVEEFLQIDREDIVGVDSFNTRKYQIEFTLFNERTEDDSNPLYQPQPTNTFVISNTAITAQKSFIDNQQHENGLLFHSKYKKSDKDQLFRMIYSNFKKDGSKEYEILRSGPVVQASLNISCDKMITEFTHAENWLQRLGRLDRFGENSNPNVYITAIPETIANTGKQVGKCARFLNNLHTFHSAKKWQDFLLDKGVGQPLTLSEIYTVYQDFYNEEQNRQAVEYDFISALKQSVKVIESKVIDPAWLKPKKMPKDATVKIKKCSLRGDNRFVQMATCKITSRKTFEFPNSYAYAPDTYDDSLTAPNEQICGYDNSEKDLLAFMVKKHHNIIGGKKTYKNWKLLDEARSPESPVYLSYTLQDLKKVESSPHPQAIYYAIGIKQPIGAICLATINQEGE